MSSIYDAIMEKAKPYLHTRQNDIHTAVSYEFAQQLLSFYPEEADPGIVLPAVILHDVGWWMVPEEEQLNAFGPNMNNKELQRLHEVEGARIAGEILRSVDYDAKKIDEIVSTIDGHDTRRTALSLNDAIVKDADKLWRYSPVGLSVDHSRFNMGRQDYIVMVERLIDRWFFTDKAREMARKEISMARGGEPA